jgi:limonene-1,2-epoxide hydrolase
MGVAEEKLVEEFLSHGHGQIDVDAIVAMMTDDVVWEVNAATGTPPIVGRDAARRELTRQSSMSSGDLPATGDLPGTEVVSMVSSDRVVLQERVAAFEMGDVRVTLRLAAAVEVDVAEGKIAAWREYFDTVDLARQLGVDPSSLVEE